MKLSMICFTGAGADLSAGLKRELDYRGHDCSGYVLEKFFDPFHEEHGLLPLKSSLFQWTKEQFASCDGLIFIGAAGIAVRSIAPWVADKRSDPAVVVLDDTGHFVISLLSGHLGGANELAEEIAGVTGGIPVITTATDIHGRFAVDTFAAKRGLMISDMEAARAVSSDVLAGEPVGFYSDFPVEGRLPEGLVQGERCFRNVWITVKRRPEEGSFIQRFLSDTDTVLRLVPRIVILGIGCRKGISKERIGEAVSRVLERFRIDERSVFAIATIDLKKEEAGLKAYAEEAGLSLLSFSAERLMAAKGDFSSSSFVKEVTGADNVCERAAVSAAEEWGGGRLIIKKQADGGVTAAAAVRDWKVML